MLASKEGGIAIVRGYQVGVRSVHAALTRAWRRASVRRLPSGGYLFKAATPSRLNCPDYPVRCPSLPEFPIPKLPAIPPTPADLDAAFGFPVPPAFDAMIEYLWSTANGDRMSFLEQSNTLGFIFTGPIERLTFQTGRPIRKENPLNVPPEFAPFAALGAGGVFNGFVVHAPELLSASVPVDLPIAEICTMDGDGVMLLGPTFANSVGHLLATTREFLEEEDEPPSPMLESLAKLFGRGGANYTEDGNLPPATPTFIPPGWRHVRTSDGIGALAPSSAFAPDQQDTLSYRGPQQPTLPRAREFLNASFPGSALAHARELWWHKWTDKSISAEITDIFAQALQQLSRPTLAAITRARIIEKPPRPMRTTRKR